MARGLEPLCSRPFHLQTPDLFLYQALIIARSSRRFHPYAWLQYDTQFRLKRASNPDMPWSSTDPELVATWLSADATMTCYSCNSPDHTLADCPLQDSGSSHCPVCSITGHTARNCPQLEPKLATPKTNPKLATPKTKPKLATPKTQPKLAASKTSGPGSNPSRRKVICQKSTNSPRLMPCLTLRWAWSLWC